MQYGLPVLINELGEISSHVREKGLGAVTGDVSEIPGILCHFDPESMRGRCLAFFAEHLAGLAKSSLGSRCNVR
jgi:hypothetical protein